MKVFRVISCRPLRGQKFFPVSRFRSFASLTALIAVAGYAAPAAADAQYNFDEGAGTTLTDVSGNGNNGTVLGGATWTAAGKNGGALEFDGTNDRVSIPSSPSLNATTAVTIEAWVFPTATQSGWRAIVQKEADSYLLHASNDAGPLRPAAGGTFPGGVVQSISAPSAIAVNTWTHLAMTYDGTAIRIFVNGTQVTSTPRTGALQTNNNQLSIAGTTVYGEFFRGRIDDVRVYTRALSVSEIQTDMNTPVGGTVPPPDTQAPSAPGGAGAAATSQTQITVNWSASTDNVGVTGYRVERCAGAGCSNFAQVGTPTGTTFNDSGLTASTSYSYRVRATDGAGNLGAYSNTATATTQAPPPDTQAPSAPGSAGATATSQTQITVSWSASTDNVGVTGYRVERCAGAACSNFTEIATPTTTSFADSGLTASTSYSYRVRATDAAGNLSGYSNTATTTTQAAPDTQAPSAPGSASATAISTTQITVSWSASTDNVGVTGYRVERCAGAGCSNFGQIGTPTGTSFSDSGLAASTNYSYRVRATDAAGNLGAYSNTASATTQTASGSAPVAAYNFDEGAGTTLGDVSGNGNVGAILGGATWAAGKNGGALNFDGTNDRVSINSSTSLSPTTAVTIEAWVFPTATQSGWRTIVQKEADVYLLHASNDAGPLRPAAGGTFNGTTQSISGPSAIAVNTWTHLAMTYDGSAIRLFVNGTQVTSTARTGALQVNNSQLSIAGTTVYGEFFRGRIDDVRIYSRALSVAEIQTDMNTPVGGTAPPPDTQAPSAPGSATAAATSSSQITVSWTASTDNVGVTGYRVERCAGAGCSNFLQVGTPTGTTFNDSGLTASTSYSYRVRATDAAGNLSAYSNTASDTTQSPPADTQAPSVPGSAGATANSSTQITVSWSASSDNVGVTGYRVERCSGAGCSNFVEVATPTATSFADSGLTASTSYSYRVRATDAAGNLSGYSNTVTASTQAPPDTQAPSAPGSAGATAISSTQITVSWSASTDNVAVTGYRVERCTGAGCSSFAQIGTPTATTFSDSSLTPSTSYSYRVRATDAAGNLGAYSNTASATTQAGTGVAGLVAAYNFDEGAGTTLNDFTANANTGAILGGATWVAGKNGGALNFDGTNDRVSINSSTSLSPTTAVTIEAWVFPTATQSGWRSIVQKEADVYLLHASNDAGPLRPAAGGTFNGTTQSISAPSAIAVNTWTHLAMTYDGSAIRIFVNGTQVASTARTGALQVNNNQLSIAGTTVYGEFFRGRIDDVRIYNRALSVSEIQTDMATPVGGTPPPPDTEAPSAPTGLSGSALSTTQIGLTWSASTDNVGVTGYRVERCTGAACTTFAQVGTPTGPAFNDSALSPSTTYRYRVRAVDAAGNLSGYSAIANATTQADVGPIGFGQLNYLSSQTPQTTVQVTYTAAQTAGRLNVVVVGWHDTTANIVSVTDTSGNQYDLAAGPTAASGSSLSQAIYYAAGIGGASAGSNKVTVTFDSPATLPDIRILEYSGIDPTSPVLTGSEASGSGALSASGSITTTHPYALLFAANTVQTSTSGAGVSYTQRVITPQGGIAEDRLVTAAGTYDAAASLASNGAWLMQLVAFRGANPPQGDTTPPTVTITSPNGGASLSGSVTFSATASDGSGVGGVQFQVDGVDVGLPDKTAPYSITFNTAQLANGTHTVSAYAWDAAENIGNSSPVSVTFSNASPGNPGTTGLWLGTQTWPFVAIHTHLMPDGRVMASDGQLFAGEDARVWNPRTNSFVTVTAPDNIFCGGHALLPDGRVLVAGGHVDAHVGINDTNIFDWRTKTWTAGGAMQFARWYPTVTTLPDGRMLVQSGESNCNGCEVPQPEVFNPATNSWTTLTTAAQYFPYYPHSYVLPDGRVFVPSTSRAPIQSKVLNLATQAWTTVGGAALDGASSVMYAPGRIIKVGTSADPDTAVRSAFATAYVIDMNQANPAWRQVASMGNPRAYPTMLNLPDGNVLTVGGGRTTDAVNYNTSNAVLAAEQWSPTTETWSPLASMSQGRLYHSTAILLPDARVLVTGGGRFFGSPDPTDQFSAELFAPPYLFRGARPVIGSAPSQIAYNEVFTVGTAQAAQVSRVVLTRLPSVTHNIDMDQAYLSLTFSAGTGSLSISAPANSNLAPPGYYMLFIVNGSGVPSVAAIVKL